MRRALGPSKNWPCAGVFTLARDEPPPAGDYVEEIFFLAGLQRGPGPSHSTVSDTTFDSCGSFSKSPVPLIA